MNLYSIELIAALIKKIPAAQNYAAMNEAIVSIKTSGQGKETKIETINFEKFRLIRKTGIVNDTEGSRLESYILISDADEMMAVFLLKDTHEDFNFGPTPQPTR